MKDTIIKAIQNKSVLKFTYDGYSRSVEPHAVGLSTAGNEVVRCYQTVEESSESQIPGWRLMMLSHIRDLIVTSDHFASPRSGYKQGDKDMAEIYAQL